MPFGDIQFGEYGSLRLDLTAVHRSGHRSGTMRWFRWPLAGGSCGVHAIRATLQLAAVNDRVNAAGSLSAQAIEERKKKGRQASLPPQR